MYQVFYNIRSGRVAQWQDTAKWNYASPDDINYSVLEVNETQFNNKSDDNWYVVDGSLTKVAPIIKSDKKKGIIRNIWNFLTKRA